MIARIVAFLVFVCAASAAAQSPSSDHLHAGYMRVYGGERDAAVKHFESLRAKDQQGLAPWFGQLFAQQARLQFEDALAPAFEQSLQQFLDAADARYSRSKQDAEALFYLAQGYIMRSTYRLNHDKGMFGAARDAAKAKGYSDTYLKQHPEHGDAYVTLGLYNYYVDIAPNFIKVLRVLLFLPSGNRAEGLKQIERAAREGSLFAPLAESSLADIYGTFEGRLAEAITIGERLVQRFPSNPAFRFDLAERYMHSTIERYDSAAEQYHAILEQKKGTALDDLDARYRATMGLANLRRSQWRLEDAIALLSPVIDQQISTPKWVLPTYLIRRANYRALLNDPGATGDAQRVTGNKSLSDWHKGAQQQITFIENRKKTANEATVYTALIPGNRHVVERRWDAAIGVYDQVAAAHPSDWQVKYRRAYLEFVRGNYDVCARALSEIVSSSAAMPAWLKAQAMLNLAWTHDLGGRRAEATKLYKRVVDDYENEGASGGARIGLITPYRR